MIITKTKIWEACAKEDDRPVLQGVHYNASKKRLEAADGWILTVSPVSETEPGETENRVIPVATVKRAQKLSKKGPAWMLMTDEGAKTPFDETTDPYIEGQFPNVEPIIAGVKDAEYIGTLDAERLYHLAMAIHESKCLAVHLYRPQSSDDSTPFLVKPVGGEDGQFGLIMPIFYPKRPRTAADLEREIIKAGYTLSFKNAGLAGEVVVTASEETVEVVALGNNRVLAIATLYERLNHLDVTNGRPSYQKGLWPAYQNVRAMARVEEVE